MIDKNILLTQTTIKWLLTLPSEGRITLQIPQFSIDFDNKTYSEIDNAMLPTGWICELKDGRVAVGNESGYTYWSRSGFEANKELIRAAFETAMKKYPKSPNNWAAFEAFARDWFDAVAKKTKKHAANLRKKAEEAEKALEFL